MAISIIQPIQLGSGQPDDEEDQQQQQQGQQSDGGDPPEENPPEEDPPQKRINTRSPNTVYAPGTGPGTKNHGVRVGVRNQDGSITGVDAMGALTGPLSGRGNGLHPSPRPPAPPNPAGTPNATASADSSGQQAGGDGSAGGGNDNNGNMGGFDSHPGRINTRSPNTIYAPGTGPGTNKHGVRVGVRNQDGSVTGVDSMGALTGPLSGRGSPFMTPRQTPPAAFAQQRQANVDQAKANGSFAAIREKFNAANPGHSMDESGTITQRSAAGAGGDGAPTPLFFRARQPGGAAQGAASSAPTTPNAPQQSQFVSAPDGQGGSKMVKLPPKPAAPSTPPASTTPATPATGAASTPPAAPAGAATTPPAATPTAPGTKPPAAPATTPPAAAATTSATPPAAAGSKPSTATFEGQSRDKFFGDAAKRQGRDNAYSKPAPAAAAPPAAATPGSKPSTATFEGQSQQQFFQAAANRQKTDNAYAKQDTLGGPQQLAGPTGTIKAGTQQFGSTPGAASTPPPATQPVHLPGSSGGLSAPPTGTIKASTQQFGSTPPPAGPPPLPGAVPDPKKKPKLF